MPAAKVIARLIGPVFVVIGVGILLNAAFYAELVAEAVQVPALVYIYGLMMLVAGLATLNAYRAWTRDWRVIITVLGWLSVIGGVIRIVLPQLVTRLATATIGTPLVLIIAAAIVFVVGGYLSFEGYRR